MKKLVILASGSGTNAQRIIEYFKEKKTAEVEAVFSNRKEAFVLQRAKKFGVPAKHFSRADFYENNSLFEEIKALQPDLIILAGFLWLIPNNILKNWHDRILNIHPALLPNYGGKGMYGHHVHEAVIKNKEKESGITIHLVNERYDEGQRLFQARCPVLPDDTADSLAGRIHNLEHKHFPEVIDSYLQKI